MKDFYYILGVDANSTLDEIKEAYRKLSKKLHPDLNQGDKYFENRFKDIKEAFEVLHDPGSRATYDREFRKTRSAGSAGEYKHDKFDNSQAEEFAKKASRSKFSRPVRRGPGIGMTITLIVIAFIIGDYAIRSFSHSKAIKTAVVSSPAVGVVSHHVLKKHKKKYGFRNKTAFVKFRPDTAGAHLTKTLPAKLQPDKPIAVKPLPATTVQVQIEPDSNINQHKKDFLYATYVRPNATGVINLRAYDNYNSNIIATIPARSKVFVLEKGAAYYRVFYDNTIGYVPKWALEVK